MKNSMRFSHASSIFLPWILLATVAIPEYLRGAEFEPAQLEKIPSRMAEFVQKQEIAGAVTVVGTTDGIVRIDSVGHRSLSPLQPMSADTLFRIASMTKPITALAIMKLADEGKLAVKDPVEKHLPEFRGQMLISARDAGTITIKKPPRPITIHDLLTHTSGLPGGFPEGLADLYVQRHRTLAEAVLVSSQRPLEFEPGTKWSYCNAGIDTLGRIVEVASGQSFVDYLARHIFQPLGMTDTTFYPSTEQLQRTGPVFEQQDGKLQPAENIIIGDPDGARHPIPAGGLYSTGKDLARLYQMTLRGGKLGDHRVISESRLAEMTRLQTGDLPCGFVNGMGFGYGFAVVREPQGVTAMLSPGTFGHGGAFGTQGWIDPARGVFVILLIQRKGLPNGDASEMRNALQTVVFEAIR